MDLQRLRWSRFFAARRGAAPASDPWLEAYAAEIRALGNRRCLELGAGLGNNLPALLGLGLEVLASDYARPAVEAMAARFPGIETRLLDLREPLPFEEASFGLVVADLCLHYFPWAETLAALDEIRRILAPGGLLLCRLNSVRDRNHGAGRGRPIELHYYARLGERKRFFDAEDLAKLFGSGWELAVMEEKALRRYAREKILWELAARPLTPGAEPGSKGGPEPVAPARGRYNIEGR